jgi:hypothetical protein
MDRDPQDGCPPFYVMPMPYNATGCGPECNPKFVVGTDYEIWDQLCLEYGSFPNQQDAEKHVAELNRKYNGTTM